MKDVKTQVVYRDMELHPNNFRNLNLKPKKLKKILTDIVFRPEYDSKGYLLGKKRVPFTIGAGYPAKENPIGFISNFHNNQWHLVEVTHENIQKLCKIFKIKLSEKPPRINWVYQKFFNFCIWFKVLRGNKFSFEKIPGFELLKNFLKFLILSLFIFVLFWAAIENVPALSSWKAGLFSWTGLAVVVATSFGLLSLTSKQN